MKSIGWARLLCIALASAAVVGFALFAPSSLGGAATWVSTSGDSMQPGIHAGDLVIARPDAGYQVGDVVAYPSATLDGTVVLHRIVATRGQALVTKGDNNDWLDPDRPRPSQVLGEMWLHIPGGGRMLTVLADPFVLAALALTLLTVGGLFTVRRDRRRGTRRARATPTRQPHLPPAGWSTQAAAGTGVGAVALAFLAFGQPLDASASENVTLTHTAALSYSADATGSDIYADDEVRTGDPVFLAVTPVLHTGLRYKLAPAGEITGTIRTRARVSAGNGWERTIALGAPTRFRSTRVTHAATVDLTKLRALGQRAERDAGTTFGGYTLEVVHDIRIEGQVAGEAVNTRYQPRLTFALDSVQAVPQGTTVPQADTGAVTLTQHDDVTVPATATATVTVLRWPVPVSILRAFTIALAAASLLLAAHAARHKHAPRDPRRIFGRRLVQASSLDLAGRPVVNIADPHDLSRLAMLYDGVVIAVRQTAADSFVVAVDNTVYRYDEPIGTGSAHDEGTPCAAAAMPPSPDRPSCYSA